MVKKFIFSLLNKIRSKRLEFPLKDIKTIALRPSIAQGEILYSLPVVKTISSKYELIVFLPESLGYKYFKAFPIKIIEYPGNLSILGVYNMRKRLKDLSCDLFIDFNKDGIDIFSFILNTPITASIYEGSSVNLQALSFSSSITDSYKHLMDLLRLHISWDKDALRMRNWKQKEGMVGISSDIGVYTGFTKVSKPSDLYKISSLITRKNNLSTIAFFLGIPQILLLKEGDHFQPPSSVKVVRYSGSITGNIIDRCLKHFND
ncbi:hypothetical protein KAT89_06970 [candidate division WOR-3 bacterium]|nr:hypothetical protein [candidate division WOR-3 bacterium]